MMTKPMKTLELHYPMIQFLVIVISQSKYVIWLLFSMNNVTSADQPENKPQTFEVTLFNHWFEEISLVTESR